MSQYTTEGRLQATVDFGFQGSGVNFAKGKPTTELRDFYALDDYFTDADSNAYSLPTFLGNHDMGRVGSFLRQGTTWDDAELLDRDELAHSLMYLTRGQPVVYYGDEQGFSAPPDVPGGIGDQRAREDMFASQVELHNDTYDLIGTDATTADENFDTAHPLYQHIADLAELREEHPALADGAQVHRYATSGPGIFAFSRMDADDQVEYVVAVNNADTEQTATFDTYQPARSMLKGVWPASAPATGSRPTSRAGSPSRSRRCRRSSTGPTPSSAPTTTSPAPVFTAPGDDWDRHRPRRDRASTVPGGDFTQVTFAWRPVGTQEWQLIGTDDNAPYRAFHDVRGLAQGTPVEYRAIARDHDGDFGVVSTSAVVGQPQPPADPGDRPRSDHPAGRRLGARQPRQRDRLRRRLGPAVRRHPADPRRRPGLEGHLQPAGRPVRVQGRDQPFVGRELRRRRQPQRVGHLLRHRRRRGVLLLRPPHPVGDQHRAGPDPRGHRRLPVRDGLPDGRRRRRACGPGCRTPTGTAPTRSRRSTSRRAPTRSPSVPVGPVAFTVEEGLATTIAVHQQRLARADSASTRSRRTSGRTSRRRGRRGSRPRCCRGTSPTTGAAGPTVCTGARPGPWRWTPRRSAGPPLPLSLDPAGLPAALAAQYPDLADDEVLGSAARTPGTPTRIAARRAGRRRRLRRARPASCRPPASRWSATIG